MTIKLTIKTYLQLTLQKKKVFGQSTIYNSFHFDYKNKCFIIIIIIIIIKSFCMCKLNVIHKPKVKWATKTVTCFVTRALLQNELTL